MARKPNISNLNISQLKDLAKDIEKALTRKTKEEMTAARKAAEKVAKEHGFSLDEIVGKSKANTPSKASGKAPLPPKYKNPEDSSETWSGRGRQPEWYKKAIASGKSPQDMVA